MEGGQEEVNRSTKCKTGTSEQIIFELTKLKPEPRKRFFKAGNQSEPAKGATKKGQRRHQLVRKEEVLHFIAANGRMMRNGGGGKHT